MFTHLSVQAEVEQELMMLPGPGPPFIQTQKLSQHLFINLCHIYYRSYQFSSYIEIQIFGNNKYMG